MTRTHSSSEINYETLIQTYFMLFNNLIMCFFFAFVKVMEAKFTVHTRSNTMTVNKALVQDFNYPKLGGGGGGRGRGERERRGGERHCLRLFCFKKIFARNYSSTIKHDVSYNISPEKISNPSHMHSYKTRF